MHHHIARGQQLAQIGGGTFTQVGVHHSGGGQVGWRLTSGAQQQGHVPAQIQHPPRSRPADKPRRAGHQGFHFRMPVPRSRLPTARQPDLASVGGCISILVYEALASVHQHSLARIERRTTSISLPNQMRRKS